MKWPERKKGVGESYYRRQVERVLPWRIWPIILNVSRVIL